MTNIDILYDKMDELRINARLDQQTSEDFQYLRETLGSVSITEVLKYSLQLAAQDLREKARAREQKQIWRESGFIGAFEGPDDSSSNYKKYLTDMLDAKYPSEQ